MLAVKKAMDYEKPITQVIDIHIRAMLCTSPGSGENEGTVDEPLDAFMVDSGDSFLGNFF